MIVLLATAVQVFAADEADLFQENDSPAVPEAPPEPTELLHMGQIPALVREAAIEARLRPLPERMRAVSEPLLGLPYVADPMGEGGVDPDPFVRYDGFDCLTFVEEVVSLATSGDPDHSAAARLGLRYGEAEPAYGTRHHFMELQWIPSNLELGRILETTQRYGQTRHMERVVDAETWERWPSRAQFALPDEQLPLGTMALDILPLELAIAVAKDVEPGSIIMVVREEKANIPIWITHVGFVVAGEEPILRHATRMRSSRRVRDHSLAWYLTHLRTYKNWPVAGVAIFEPVDVGPRLSLLEP